VRKRGPALNAANLLEISRFRPVADFFNSCLFSNLWLCENGAQKGTPDAFPDIAQQLGNGAIVEKLCSGRSFFGVRTRGEGSKGYTEKGAPAKKFAAASND